MLKIKVLTILPEVLSGYLNAGIIGRAQKQKAIKLEAYNLRDWTTDPHRSVDDKPYGGGAGMVMRADVIAKAITQLRKTKDERRNKKKKVVLLSAKGKTWNQALAKKYSKLDEVIFVCGRFEGVDERVMELVDEEVSIGDYVLTGGELGAMVLIDSITRLLPGVLGNEGSLKDESHNTPGVLEYPQYTRPEAIKIGKKTLRVPEVLLNGNHKEIDAWRKSKQKA